MSDTQDRDEQDGSEAIDEDEIDDLEYPPERPLGVTDYGVTPQEERIDEPIEERLRREVPDGLSGAVEAVPLAADVAGTGDQGALDSFDDDVDLLDPRTGALEAELAEEADNPYAHEPDHAPRSAEEDAVHIVADPS